jgi:CRISPR-associated protein Csm1
MEDTTLKIALAGLLHDIGKFADNEIFRLNQKEIAAKRSEFVSGKQNSYNHAVYTSEFISVYKKYLPEICSITEWGEGNESLEIIAASHHSPGSPYQEIITQADCISSGMDRQNSQDNDSTDYREYKNTRMVPVLEALDFDKKNFNKPYTKDNFKYMLSLKEVNPASIFPVPKNENNQKNKKESANEYIELFNRFENDLSKIIHKDKIELWFEHIDSLLQKYTSMIPSARAGKTVPDISLYDHLKTTSGIAAAIYLYHKENDSLSTNDIKDKNTKKFILISGDFHGIQEFIFTGYGDTRKSRSKLFRGRSFYVSLAAELAADLLCRKIGLPHTSIVLSAGGKFTIIAPNTKTTEKALDEAQTEITDWFSQITYCQSGISFSYTKASYNDFYNNKFGELYNQINKNLLEKKLSKFDIEEFGGVVIDYFNGKSLKLCPYCGKRPGNHKYQGNDICGLCEDQIIIGKKLVKSENNTIAVYYSETEKAKGELKENIFGYYNLKFCSDNNPEEKNLIKFFKISDSTESNIFCTIKNISGYVPEYDNKNFKESVTFKDDEEFKVKPGDVMLFEDIAQQSLSEFQEEKLGLEALGILKADVDNLGLLMGCGLKENIYSISRIASVSRQLDNFFTVFLPYYLENNYRYIYTVFAGGDDLFLIGPWNEIYDLSLNLRKSFEEYTAFNKNITFSAGIYICKPNTPVDTIANEAEEFLEKSKDINEKNSLTIFGETASWKEFEKFNQIEKTMKQWLSEKIISSSMLYRLNKFCELSEIEDKLLKSSRPNLNYIDTLKWKSLLVYSLTRNLSFQGTTEDKQIQAKSITEKIIKWIETYRGSFRIPLWNLLYSIRKK